MAPEALGRPREVIAGEERLLAIQQHLMAARMARRRNTQQIGSERDRLLALGHVLDPEPRRSIVPMHDARTVKMSRELRVVGDVVPVREKHEGHAAHLFEAFDERTGKSGRIDEDIAAVFRPADDQIRPRAEARLGRKAAEEHVREDVGGKRVSRLARIPMRARAYRGRGTGDQRHERPMNLLLRVGLVSDARLVAMIAKRLRRNLAAGVTVDASVIDIKVAFNVLRESTGDLSHSWRVILASRPRVPPAESGRRGRPNIGTRRDSAP